MLMVMEILNQCVKKGIQVWTIKDNFRLGDDIQSKVIAFAFSLAAEIERQLIAQRTREALARRRAEGKILGRPKGSATELCKRKLFRHEKQIVNMLRRGENLRYMCEKLHVSRDSLRKYIIERGLRQQDAENE